MDVSVSKSFVEIDTTENVDAKSKNSNDAILKSFVIIKISP